VEVRDAAHRQAGEIAHEHAIGLRDCDGERADCCGLIYDYKRWPVICESVENLGDAALGIRERPVVELLPVAGECDGVMLALADIEADEDRGIVVVFDLVQGCASVPRWFGSQVAVGVGIHVTNDPCAYTRSGLAPISDHSPPGRAW